MSIILSELSCSRLDINATHWTTPVFPEPVVDTGDVEEVDAGEPPHSVAKLEVVETNYTIC